MLRNWAYTVFSFGGEIMFGKKQQDFEPKRPKESISSRAGRNPFLRFILTFLKSWNPDAYSKLGSKPIRESLGYFFVLLAVSILVGFSFFIPKLLSSSGPIEGFLSQFSALSIQASAQNPADFNFGIRFRMSTAPKSQPSNVGLNVSNSSQKQSDYLEGSDLVLSPSGLYAKRLSCLIFSPSCFFGNAPVKIGGEGFFDVLKYKAEYARIMKLAILLMLPSIFIVLFAGLSVKFLALSLIASMLLYLIFKFLKHNLSFRAVLSSSIYALTPLVVLNVLNIFLSFLSGWLELIPYLLYAVLLISGLLMREEDVF
ncbi:MAG: hypothetical protein QW439_01605 [Candidatus Woesearchaeota archaeon]